MLLYKDNARKLEEETRGVLCNEREDFLTILELIDHIQRWDVNAVKDLPEHMKFCFLALHNIWAYLCKAFLQEAKWSHKKSIPSFDEYIENGWRSVSGAVTLMHAYFMLDQDITKEALNSLVNNHELLKWPSIIPRLRNDLGTSSDELARGETANFVLYV
ncbi:hypothetical protein GH714_043187 [Hevea brasiliensis]|uniref:Terpene synthase metal-binding domain-containing protein n=1 Tax=Hevea brasiliensis TaxID=3981 RepID=A0A6A6K2J0_HEVBR|nr:hypothetical protein GH714_043187 [Hevea brasiliensis]